MATKCFLYCGFSLSVFKEKTQKYGDLKIVNICYFWLSHWLQGALNAQFLNSSSVIIVVKNIRFILKLFTMGTEAQCINTLNVPFAIQQIPTKAAIYILSGHWWVGSTYWLLISPTESNLDFPQHICDSGSSYKAILKVLPTRSCIMKNPSKGLWFPSFDLVMSIR